MPRSSSATFRAHGHLLHADTCEPLKAAAAAGLARLDAFGRGSYPGRRLRRREIPEVSSLGCWDARADQPWGLDWHRNEGIELTFLAAGRLPFEVDGRAFTLSPNDLTITRPWQRHRVGDPRIPASRLIWLILDVGVRRPNQPWRWPEWVLLPPARIERLTRQLRQNEQPVWRAGSDLGRAFGTIAAAAAEERADTTRLKIAINEVLLSFADLIDRRRPRLDARLSTSEHAVRVFLGELEARVEEPWTLEAMAAQCGLGRTAFGRLCRTLTNRTPMAHLASCRIRHACRLMRDDPGRPIIQVALASGFRSSQYFATVFTRHLGTSPHAWRRSVSSVRDRGGAAAASAGGKSHRVSG